jgi:hypothetical protein
MALAPDDAKGLQQRACHDQEAAECDNAQIEKKFFHAVTFAKGERIPHA